MAYRASLAASLSGGRESKSPLRLVQGDHVSIMKSHESERAE